MSKNYILPVLAGIGAGLLLALLSHRKDNKVTKAIKEKGEDYLDEMKARYEELLSDLSGKLEALKAEAAEKVARQEREKLHVKPSY